ncbi:multidrug effflux MFS transporter [Kyrpidia spormannii]|uniref:Bcr/CflA family efflux transporter n=1 Tax=Kyrpidia spormannii TaxID=2055160 RepID=A0A6F9E5H5_9BACL|nr:multidrug effflux MFS transporter [Kyrpidia spormannii]CAB3391652.1 Bcr/CflA family efflux transporter [Kyrpidia spormannii]
MEPSIVKEEILRPRRGILALVLGGLTGLGPFTVDMYLPSLPVLAEDFRVGASTVQLSLMACLLGLASGQLVAGPISDARGRRGPVLVGLLIYALASVMAAWVGRIEGFIALRFVQGMAGSAGIVIARAIARDHFEGPELTRFFALLMVVNGAAPVLAPVIGGQILRVTSWRGVFLVLGGLGILLWLTVWGLLAETHPPHRRVRGGVRATIGTLGQLLKNAEFLGYVLAQGFAFAAMFSYISGSSFVLQQEYGVSAQGFSAVFAVNGIGIVLSGQIAARAAVRWGERRVLGVSLVVAVLGSLLLLGGVMARAGLALVLPTLFVAIAVVGAISTMCTSLALQDHGRVAGSAAAWLGVSGQLIGGLVTPLVGLGPGRIAITMAGLIMICHLFAAVVYKLLSGRRAAMDQAEEAGVPGPFQNVGPTKEG